MNGTPLLVVSDLHLGPAAPQGADVALSELLGRYPERELVCLGDLFDLSTQTHRERDKTGTFPLLAPYPQLRDALKRHLSCGGAVTMVAGNHDAELVLPAMRSRLLAELAIQDDANLTIEPWWIRRDRLHLEHGHVWDPDNAPIHPLSPVDARFEPLGVALTRHVIAPLGAFQLAHAHHTTPLAGLKRVLSELNYRAPEIIARYFLTAIRIVCAAATNSVARLRNSGELALDDFAKARGIPPQLAINLDRSRPTPRHASCLPAFARLYLDRAAAGVGLAIALAYGATTQTAAPLLPAAAALAYLAASKGDRAHRYSGSLVRRIREAAQLILEQGESSVVVFGHTHVEQAMPGYINTGAFGYPGQQGRPFLLQNDDGSLHRGYLDEQGNHTLLPINC